MKLPWTAVAAAVSSRWDFKPNDNGDDYKHVAKDGELTHSEINVLREALGLPTITDDLDDSNKFVTLVYDKLLAFAEKYKVTHTLADKEAEADASAAATTKGEEKTVVGFVFGKMSVEASAE